MFLQVLLFFSEVAVVTFAKEGMFSVWFSVYCPDFYETGWMSPLNLGVDLNFGAETQTNIWNKYHTSQNGGFMGEPVQL